MLISRDGQATVLNATVAAIANASNATLPPQAREIQFFLACGPHGLHVPMGRFLQL